MIDLARAAHEAATVRQATPHELDSLAAVLARAFYDDPVFRWVVDDDSRRLRLLQRSFRLYLRRLWFAQDECYTTENVADAIVWELPGQWKAGVLDQLRLLPSMLAINGRLLPRILRALAATESDHPVEPHCYLPVVGVEPEWQGRGLGTALMRPVLERCDDEKLPAYLEATSPRNRALTSATDSRSPASSRSGPGRRRHGGCGGLLTGEPQRTQTSTRHPLNGKLPGSWSAFGDHDGCSLIEAPDDPAAASVLPKAASGGVFTTSSTTEPISGDDALEASLRASELQYRPPVASA